MTHQRIVRSAAVLFWSLGLSTPIAFAANDTSGRCANFTPNKRFLPKAAVVILQRQCLKDLICVKAKTRKPLQLALKNYGILTQTRPSQAWRGTQLAGHWQVMFMADHSFII